MTTALDVSESLGAILVVVGVALVGLAVARFLDWWHDG